MKSLNARFLLIKVKLYTSKVKLYTSKVKLYTSIVKLRVTFFSTSRAGTVILYSCLWVPHSFWEAESFLIFSLVYFICSLFLVCSRFYESLNFPKYNWMSFKSAWILIPLQCTNPENPYKSFDMYNMHDHKLYIQPQRCTYWTLLLVEICCRNYQVL